jgi:hypothetical protein
MSAFKGKANNKSSGSIILKSLIVRRTLLESKKKEKKEKERKKERKERLGIFLNTSSKRSVSRFQVWKVNKVMQF